MAQLDYFIARTPLSGKDTHPGVVVKKRSELFLAVVEPTKKPPQAYPTALSHEKFLKSNYKGDIKITAEDFLKHAGKSPHPLAAALCQVDPETRTILYCALKTGSAIKIKKFKLKPGFLLALFVNGRKSERKIFPASPDTESSLDQWLLNAKGQPACILLWSSD